MPSTYTVSPSSLYNHRDHSKDRILESHHTGAIQNTNNHSHPITPGDSHLLSSCSSHLRSNSASPTGNSYTPAESTSSRSVYQPSDFSSDFDDPYFGVNFNDLDSGTLAFLDDPPVNFDSIEAKFATTSSPPTQSQFAHNGDFPLSSTKPSLGQTTSQVSGYTRHDSDLPTRESISVPFGHLKYSSRSGLSLADPNHSAPQLTPDTNGGGWSSDDSLAPGAISAMSTQSPRVTVSYWGKDEERAVYPVGQSFAPGAVSLRTVPMGMSADDMLSNETVHGSHISRDTQGNWLPDTVTGHCGLGPEHRPSAETCSVNQLTTDRQISERNQVVAAWVSESVGNSRQDAVETLEPTLPVDMHDNVPAGDIPLGHTTENKYVSGQMYYHTEKQSGGITQTDLNLMHQSRNWADAPLVHSISQIDSTRHQPESSQDAIEKFERMARDNDSVLSRAATWGTRRRSLPSQLDIEGVISGSFLRKLTIRGDSSTRRPSLLKKFPGLGRRPSASQLLKRKGSNADESVSDLSKQGDRRESRDSLAPPRRRGSWGMNKKSMSSLNTALVGMATGAATIGTSHARSGSISATSITSPTRNAFLPVVKNTLRRPRSKTELPKESHPNLMGMLKQEGGPPAARLARSQPTLGQDDEDDDEDDETFDDSDVKIDSGQFENIVPNFAGFQNHIRRLNPSLADTNTYLVDRIAHQMIVRFKSLQNSKIKHLRSVHQQSCPSETLCISQGGFALALGSRGYIRGLDPLSAQPSSSDGDVTVLEGCINPESFPSGIPMPPVTSLPAEFECQLCYQAKKFQKPSDWTKHVHEDVQPFTCTWDRCRDPKIFKRKADWVRHENEGHRHLEWWTCDVEDCRHTCYRRENFLQHLIREHKFAEPKVKTKAAIKKAGGGDLTWQKVEKCHVETHLRPQDEPCRFCGKIFLTWKKLTVHLAKHMEQISLPVLRLVAAKDLDADTIISPVQDPPIRNFPSLSIKQEQYTPSPQRSHAFSNPSPGNFQQQHTPLGHENLGQAEVPSSFYDLPQIPPFDNFTHNQASGLMMPQVTTGFSQQSHYQTLPVTSGPSYGQQASTYLSIQSQIEPFPSFNPVVLQDSSGEQFSYDGLADPTIQTIDHYSNHGSVSPYSHSPNQGPSGFYNI